MPKQVVHQVWESSGNVNGIFNINMVRVMLKNTLHRSKFSKDWGKLYTCSGEFIPTRTVEISLFIKLYFMASFVICFPFFLQ